MMTQINDDPRIKRLNALALTALAGFAIGAAIFLVMPNWKTSPSIVGTLLLEMSTVVLIVAFVAREFVCRQAWRFSLRHLLIATTVAAITLAFIGYIVRK